MACGSRSAIQDAPETGEPYVVRTCDDCGRKIRVRERGKHGIGIEVKKGDQFVLPEGFIQISANPLKGGTAHSISRSAMYFRSSWRPPCGSSRHTSSSTTSMSVWVRWLRSLSRNFFRWGIAALHGHAGGSATLSATDAYGTKPSR